MLADFYRSKDWLNFRPVVIDERTNDKGLVICEHCGRPIVKSYDLILHHIIALTEENYRDSEVSLNPDNISLVHHRCHNKIHDKLGYSCRQVFIVYGSPLSGKSTWVAENMTEGDLIIDLDAIWQAVSGCDRYIKPNRLKSVVFSVRDKYNTNVSYASLSKMLLDTKIYGFYRGNPNYCQGYVDEYTFNKIQLILKNNVKQSSSRRVYLFSGLIPCPSCGRKLSAGYTDKQRRQKNGKVYEYTKDYYSYRCHTHNTEGTCDFRKRPNEDKIEKALLEKFNSFMDVYITTSKIEDDRVQSSTAADLVKELKAERERVNRIYRKGGMPDNEYDREIDLLNERIKGAELALEPIEKRDLSRYEELLKSDWKELYNALTRENKRSFWRTYIKAIILDLDGKVKDVVFF